MRKLQVAALTEAVLGGVPLPASKEDLLAYAEQQNPPVEVREALAGIPEQEYRALDDVAEAIARVQPSFNPPDPGTPKPESDEPAGGEAYTDPSAEPGTIRDEPETLEYEEQLVKEPET